MKLGFSKPKASTPPSHVRPREVQQCAEEERAVDGQDVSLVGIATHSPLSTVIDDTSSAKSRPSRDHGPVL